MCRVWPWSSGSCFANEEQKKKKIARDVDDISVTQSGLVRNITNTDCLKNKQMAALRVAFSPQLQAGYKIDRIAAVYLFLFDSYC